jgi:TonB family protein
LFDDLVKHFGEHMVFMDVAGIEAGRDFRKAIEESVARCGVLLVVMGPEWLNAKNGLGARRLDDPADFVRIETASALRRDIPVVPVLVHGAEMPRAEQLPDDLKDLAYRNCIELTHARWRSDIQLLIEALRRLVGDAGPIGTGPGPKQPAASAQPGTAHQRATGSSQQENESSARIDPAVMQRVTRELALYIGPIADIVVKRAASRCTSVEDLCLKVAEEIDSRDERERFLQERASIPSTPLPDVARATTPARHASGGLGSVPGSEETDAPIKTPPSPTKTRQSSRWTYLLLICGTVISLILVLVLARHFATSRETGSSQTVQTSAQETHNAASASVKTSPAPPLAETPAKTDMSTQSPATSATAASQPRPTQRVRVPQGVSQGLIVSKVVPVYPPLARQAHIQGRVILQAAISKDGRVEALRGVSGHPMLIPAAIEAVKQWRYQPYAINGKPVAVETQIVVNFTLKGG